MRPDLKAAEELMDSLERRFPDARADVEAARTQMGLRRRTAESHNGEITDRLARDSDKKPVPSASTPQVEKGPPVHGPNDTYVYDPVAAGFVVKESSCEDRMKEPSPMPPEFDKQRLVTLMDYIAEKDPSQKERALTVRKELGMEDKEVPPLEGPMRGMVSALFGIEESATAEPDPKIGETFRPDPPFYAEAEGIGFPPVPTITLSKLASLLQVSPEEVAANLRYMNLRSGPMGRPYPKPGDTLSLRTAYALHLQLNGNSAAHLWAPVELSTSGHYAGPVLAFIESTAFPKLAKLLMSQPYYDIRDAILPLIKEKEVEMTKDVRRRAESLAMELRHFGNVQETEEG